MLGALLVPAARNTARTHHLIRFILYSRSYCHLCDDMLHALQAMPEASGFAIEVVDVDADAALVGAYDELVPVLVGMDAGGASRQLCHYFLDHQAVKAFLAG